MAAKALLAGSRQAAGTSDWRRLAQARVQAPPQVRGHLTKVWIEAGRMFQQFDSGVKVPPTTRPNRAAKNYMYYYGSTLRFGKYDLRYGKAPSNIFAQYYPIRCHSETF